MTFFGSSQFFFFLFQMPQTVPSAGFTPPCDYSNFADNFDLSLLPGGDQPLSPSTPLYTNSPPPGPCDQKPKIFTTYYANSPQSQENNELDWGPDFQKLLVPQEQNKPKTNNLYPSSPLSGIYLEVPSSKNYHANSPAGAVSPYSQGLLSPNDQFTVFHSPTSEQTGIYPHSPDVSLYNNSSPGSNYCRSPCEDFLQSAYVKKETQFPPSPVYPAFKIKEENYHLSPCGFTSSPTSPSTYSNSSDQVGVVPETQDVFGLLATEKQIKQESTVDFSGLLEDFEDTEGLRVLLDDGGFKREEKAKDHQLLREVLRDTSFQRKFNIRTFDLGFMNQDIKMEEPEQNAASQNELLRHEQMREHIEPVLNMAIGEMRKEVDKTCAALGIVRGRSFIT